MMTAVAARRLGQEAVELYRREIATCPVSVHEIDERELVREDGGIGFVPVQRVAVGVRERRALVGIRFPGAAGDPEAVAPSRVRD